MRKFFKICLTLLQIAVACLLIALGGFFWRLHKAPINVNDMIPYLVEAATSSDTASEISIGSAQLRWGGWRNPVDFVAEDFKAFDEQGRLMLTIPKMSLSFSLTALLRGTIAPRKIAIYRPYLHLQIDQKGELKEGDISEDKTTEDKKAVLPIDTVVRMLKREEHLTEFSLVKAEIKITDSLHKAEWLLPSVNLTYSRRFRKNQLRGSFALQMKNNKILMVDLNGRWKGKGKKIAFSIGVQNLDLRDSLAAQKYPYLKNFTTPISITLNTQLDALPLLNKSSFADWHKAIDKIDFEITGGAGIINLPAPIIARYNLSRFKVNGSWYAAGNNFDIPSFELVTQSGATAQGNMSVTGIAEAINSKKWEKIQAVLKAEAANVPMDMLPDYWPGSVGPDVHEWVKQNLKGGMITDGKFALHFTGLKEGGIDADKVDGTVNVINTQVSYMDGMPPISDVSGNVHLTRDIITITVAQGHTDSITIQNGGTLTFLDLEKPLSSAVLDLNLTGNVRDILTVLDAPPLGLTKDMGLKAENTTGTAAGNLWMSFPIGDAFESADQIKIKANADVRNADVNDIALGYGLQDSILQMELNNRDLSLTGTALFYTSTAKFTLSQTFDKTKQIQSDIQLHIDLNERARAQMGYEFLMPPAVSGVLPSDLNLVMKNNGEETIEITIDLTQAQIDIREIGWAKPQKTPGNAFFKILMHKGTAKSIPLIKLTDANDTNIQGSMQLSNNGKISDLEFNPIRTGRTNAKLRMRFLPDMIAIDLAGAELDISGLIGKGPTFSSDSAEDKESNIEDDNFTIQAVIDKLWLSKTGFSENNAFTAVYRSGWENMQAVGYIGEQKVPLRLALKPTQEEDKYSVSMISEDAGYILKALDYISTVKGGKLKLNGIYTSGVGSKGNVTISDFYLEEQQILMRILTLTSLTGIIDTWRGEGLFFSKADIPYTTDSTSLSIQDAVIAGSSLGITLNGKYYRDTAYINLRGSLIPFYTLNSFLGKIPLIGKLFSGEKGGGLIAPTYTVKGKLPSPDISVNAFSALAPGAIRSLFEKMTFNDSDLSKKETPVLIPQKTQANVPSKPADPGIETEFTDFLHHEF